MIAVSGGSDSVALAHAAVEVARAARDSGSCQSVVAPVFLAHVNHHLRGAESDADERLVHELATKWGATPALASAPSAAVAEGKPREGLLRRLRYEALARLATERGARLVLTAHHADDVAETILFRLMRGTGLRGLRGIPFSRPLTEGVSLVRPLIGIRKADLSAYATTHGLEFRSDRSNDQPGPSRNWIRHEVLPGLSDRFGGAVTWRLVELAREAACVIAMMDASAAELLETCRATFSCGAVRLDCGPLRTAAAAVVQALLHQIWNRQNWPQGAMTRGKWQHAIACLAAGDSPRAIELPGSVTILRDPDGHATIRGPRPNRQCAGDP